MTFDETSPAATDDHLAASDALLRFGAGVDRGSMHLLASAFCEEAEVDFGPCGRKMGLDFPVLTGHATIVGFLAATASSQTTSHVITNIRVHAKDGGARLRALVDATHLPRGNHARQCRMMNWYEADLVRQAPLWRIRRLVIDNVWFNGDPQVLAGGRGDAR